MTNGTNGIVENKVLGDNTQQSGKILLKKSANLMTNEPKHT